MKRRSQGRPKLTVDELGHRKTLTIAEAVRLTGFSQGVLYELVAQRKVDFVRPTPHRTMIYRESLERYIEAHKTPAIEGVA